MVLCIGLACSGPMQMYPGKRLAPSNIARVDLGDLEAPIKVDGREVHGSAVEVMPGRHRISGLGHVQSRRFKVASSFDAAAGRGYEAHLFWTAKRRDLDEPPSDKKRHEVEQVLLIEDANREREGYHLVEKNSMGDHCSAASAQETECPDVL